MKITTMLNQVALVNQREVANLDDINYLKQYIELFKLIYPNSATAFKTKQNEYLYISPTQVNKFNRLSDEWLLKSDDDVWFEYPKISQQLVKSHQHILEKKKIISLNICKYQSEFIYETITHTPIINPKNHVVVGELLEFNKLQIQDKLDLAQSTENNCNVCVLDDISILDEQERFILLLMNLNFSYYDIVDILNSYETQTNVSKVKNSIVRLFKKMNVTSLVELKNKYKLRIDKMISSYQFNLNVLLYKQSLLLNQ